MRRTGRKKRRGSMERKRGYAGMCFVMPGLAGVLIFYLLPYLDVIRRSFFSAVGGTFVGVSNYRTVLTNEAFLQAAGNMIRFLLVCLPLLLFLSMTFALLLKAIAGQKRAAFYKSAYLIPLAIPAASVVLLWKVVFDRHGMLNGLLNGFSVDGVDWMNSNAAFYVLVFSYIWKNLGYDVVLWLAGFSTVPETVYEAAKVDGAGALARFWWITLPCIRPVTFMIVIISVLNSFKVFREAWLVAGNYPQESIYLLQHLFNNWFRSLSVDKMSAGAVLLGIVIFSLVLIFQKGWDTVEGADA